MIPLRDYTHELPAHLRGLPPPANRRYRATPIFYEHSIFWSLEGERDLRAIHACRSISFTVEQVSNCHRC
jgi:hypothetical protein